MGSHGITWEREILGGFPEKKKKPKTCPSNSNILIIVMDKQEKMFHYP